jgi:hypothetical protein
MASSYHSRGSVTTNHLSNFSEESTEGWASFTSGNVSKSDLDDSDDDDDEQEFAGRSGEEEIMRMLRRSPKGSIATTPPPSAIEAKSILRNKGEGLSSSIMSA